MKKNILLIVLSSVLLAGCSLSDIFPWGKKDNEPKQDTPKNLTSKTINFYGSYLYEGWTTQGVNMDSTMLSCDDQNERLRALTSAQVDNNSSLLSELFFTKLNTGYYDYVNSTDLAITIGTGDPSKNKFQSGTFVWTSVKKIYTIEVTAKCYEKGEYTLDSNAHLSLEAGTKGSDVEYSRPITDSIKDDYSFEAVDGAAIYKTYSKTYEKGIDRFCLTSKKGRVVIQSLKIFWELG